ncbi:hypothetical protein Mgra_00009653 [Meloidogyne graminicola]|uniref:Uncharacterized protein n=1 Tax=Meloidogyne graminicola TaxID=189291 RepID=A0A8S9ZBZ4_9BILA|nr:hypothetical protein Mgra_00009653 [Meloidogyne graminicola]
MKKEGILEKKKNIMVIIILKQMN